MKALRRFLTLAAVLIMGMAAASAFDASNIMMSEYLGDDTLEEFESTFEEITEEYFLAMMEQSLGNDASINEFYQLTPDICSPEEKDMLDTVEDYLIEKEGISNNEIYMVMAIKGIDMMNSSMSAWIVISHCDNDIEFTHYAYFISIGL
ncbi:MAG: hypothetical protein IKR40_04510 [Treponema sp.]|nr:hypothetical protein [Treponema sp.]